MMKKLLLAAASTFFISATALATPITISIHNNSSYPLKFFVAPTSPNMLTWDFPQSIAAQSSANAALDFGWYGNGGKGDTYYEVSCNDGKSKDVIHFKGRIVPFDFNGDSTSEVDAYQTSYATPCVVLTTDIPGQPGYIEHGVTITDAKQTL